jgi:hypothetical protein
VTFAMYRYMHTINGTPVSERKSGKAAVRSGNNKVKATSSVHRQERERERECVF